MVEKLHAAFARHMLRICLFSISFSLPCLVLIHFVWQNKLKPQICLTCAEYMRTESMIHAHQHMLYLSQISWAYAGDVRPERIMIVCNFTRRHVYPIWKAKRGLSELRRFLSLLRFRNSFSGENFLGSRNCNPGKQQCERRFEIYYLSIILLFHRIKWSACFCILVCEVCLDISQDWVSYIYQVHM